jgi:hypothetical protein
VVQRAAFAQRHADHRALRGVSRLADRFRNLARLAVTVADAALLIAGDDESGEAEATATLHHLGDAVHGDELVDDFTIATVAVTAITTLAVTATLATFTALAAGLFVLIGHLASLGLQLVG